MPSKRKPAPVDGALFARPDRVKGPRERAIERQITEWRADGRTIGPALSSSLRSQAFAVDLSHEKGDPWQIGNANRVMLELMDGYGLIDAGGVDPFTKALLEAGLTDDDDPAGAAAAPLRHEPPA